MSVTTLPLVLMNLGGEMLYILDQRLRAQSACEDKSCEKAALVWSENDRKRVMNDIIGTMFSKAFMDELLKPQPMYSHRTMKVVLTRLAHVSIMKLNPVSMDKLYELILMAFKYQVFHCPRPKDLLLISYNHIDSIRQFVKDTPAILNKVDETHRKIIEVYSSVSEGEFQLLRQTLLTFLQDTHIRVSIFLKNKIQNPNGRFAMPTSGPVPHGMDVPGTIRNFDNKGRETRRYRFPTGGNYCHPVKDASFGLHGERVIKLGVNMYCINFEDSSKVPKMETASISNPLAKEELNLLARLMGTVEVENIPGSETGFHFNLLVLTQEEDADAASGGAEESFGVVNIKPLQDEKSAAQLAQIAGLFAEHETREDVKRDRGDELLAMMDDLMSM
ncbi:protein OSCP1a [Corythoichthys intestinalis]|uniref:protein OSCP1a n=1 Tax=Corythoichthys intestinalis TaxID=161448 RepID=UPI0025A54500|nr:protein OSCP1a [Corythoichthys intestinalis]